MRKHQIGLRFTIYNLQFIRFSFYTLIFILLSAYGYSQPILTGLQYNPVIKNYLKAHPNCLRQTKAAPDTLQLPFFDDFAKPNVYPDSTLWLDKLAYINTNYGNNPPSLGVATLDIIDSTGKVYTNASVNSFIADYLTSKPINLNYQPSDSIYLSFYYQPKGNSYNGPESQDSLVLEFKTPSINWQSVWRAEGSSNISFKQAMIPITQSTYLQNGFQFRFKNYATTAGLSLQGWTSNGDLWNIDWVKIDTGRTINDTIADDVSLVYGSRSFLKDYESIPWKHYQSVTSQQLDSFKLAYRNNSSQTKNIQRFVNLYKVNNNNLTLDSTFNLGSENVAPNQYVNYSMNFSYNLFPQTSAGDSALFLIKSYLIWDTVAITRPLRWNDTASYHQKFYNYYAYDDGSPESGFCLNGQGAQNAKLAYKCHTYQADTLRAIQMYFNQTSNNNQTSQQYFYLNIWNDNGGKPGTVIYSQIGARPEYYGLNVYHNYVLDSAIALPQGDFYVGWIQTTPDCLNIGFDLSKNEINKIYYDIGGSWQQETSGFEGSIMMRPVFGKTLPTNIVGNRITESNLKVYPNPANDVLNIDLNNNTGSKLYICNIGGQLMRYEILNSSDNKINIATLQSGMYIIKIVTSSQIHYSKFIKE